MPPLPMIPHIGILCPAFNLKSEPAVKTQGYFGQALVLDAVASLAGCAVMASGVGARKLLSSALTAR